MRKSVVIVLCLLVLASCRKTETPQPDSHEQVIADLNTRLEQVEAQIKISEAGWKKADEELQARIGKVENQKCRCPYFYQRRFDR
jgi:uncharacterized protein YcfL